MVFLTECASYPAYLHIQCAECIKRFGAFLRMKNPAARPQGIENICHPPTAWADG